MLQQNGPTGEKNVEVIDNTPDRQCPYCGCLTRQSRCPECNHTIALSNGAVVVRQLHVFWIHRLDENGQWGRRTLITAANDTDAAREAYQRFEIPDGEPIRTEDLGALPQIDRQKAYEQEVERQLAEIHHDHPADVEPEELEPAPLVEKLEEHIAAEGMPADGLYMARVRRDGEFEMVKVPMVGEVR